MNGLLDSAALRSGQALLYPAHDLLGIRVISAVIFTAGRLRTLESHCVRRSHKPCRLSLRRRRDGRR